MIAAVYARKSTEQNVAEDAKSVTRQVEHARSYAAGKGWTVAGEHVYVDDGISGAEFEKRPGFMRLVGAIRNRADFQVLVMSDLDRLGREPLETGYYIKKILELGVRIFGYLDNQEIRLDNYMDVMMLQMRSSAAGIERDSARKRVHEAMSRRARAGHVTGGRCFGYDNVDVTSGVDASGRPIRSHVDWKQNPQQASVVLRIFEAYAKGSGLKQIAKQLNAENLPCPRPRKGLPAGWSPSSIHAMLRRPIYRGEVVWNKTKKRLPLGQKKHQHRPETDWVRCSRPDLQIVPDALWNAVQERLRRESERYLRAPDGRILSRPARHVKYLLSGLTQCACGAGLEVVSRWDNHKKRPAYACAANRRKGPRACNNDHVLYMKETDDAVLSAIERILDPDRIERAVDRALERLTTSDTVARRGKLEAESKTLEKKIARLVAMLEDGDEIAPLKEALRQRQARYQDVQQELRSLDVQRAALDRGSVRRDLLRRVKDWRGLLRKHPEQGRQILRKLIVGRLVFEPRTDGNVAFRGTGTMKGLLFDGTIGDVTRAMRMNDPSNTSMVPVRGFEPRSRG
jgi:site-specific DNA recombinase